MNYANMGIKRRVLIRQNQSNFESVQRKKIIKKDLKNQNANISFVFWVESLCKKKLLVQSPGGYFRLSKIIIGLRYII